MESFASRKKVNVVSRFFHFNALTKDLYEINSWLKEWIELGGIPVGTGCNPTMTAAYHSMIYGCTDSTVFFTNPLNSLDKKKFQQFISAPFLLIPADEVIQRVQEDLKESKMDKEEYFKQFNSLPFVSKNFGEKLAIVVSGGTHFGVKLTHVKIAWHGLTGVTIFAKEGTKAFEKLKQIEQDEKLVSKLSAYPSMFEFFTEVVMKPFNEKVSEEERPSPQDIKGIRFIHPLIDKGIIEFAKAATQYSELELIFLYWVGRDLTYEQFRKICLGDCRTVDATTKFMKKMETQIQEEAEKLSKKFESKFTKEAIANILRSRLLARYIYIGSEPSEKMLPKIVKAEERAFTNKLSGKPITIKLTDSIPFTDAHLDIRVRSYPYKWISYK